MNAALEVANTFAVDDAHLQNSARPAFVEIGGHKIANVLRAKCVQVEHAVDWQRE